MPRYPCPKSFELPGRAGIGLKAEHYRVVLETHPDIGFFEVHAENYMGDGGPPHRYLSAIRESYPLSIHGVGLSLGADRPLDKDHLCKLKRLISRYEPAVFSEHLAWSTHDTGFLNDLLPMPYTDEALERVADHIDEVQEALGRTILLENPSTYISFAESKYAEAEFIAAVAHRTGCGLLLDLNNLYVSSVNHGTDPLDYLNVYPLSEVCEIHLAGHLPDTDDNRRLLLIDSHDRAVDARVWDLLAEALLRIGPAPVLIEWDSNIPTFPILKSQADLADEIIVARKSKAYGCPGSLS